MIARLAALAAGVVAATGAAGAAVWARRRGGDDTARKGRRRRKAAVRDNAVPTQAQPEPRAADSAREARPVPTAAAGPGGLRTIKGIGAVSAERLGALGVTTVAQIAAWSEDDVESMAAQIKVSPERIRREDWVGQAKAALLG